MYATALALLALDDRDDAVVSALVAAHGRLGLSRVVLLWVEPKQPMPSIINWKDSAEIVAPDAVERAAARLRAVGGLQVEVMTRRGGVDAAMEAAQELQANLIVIGRGRYTEGANAWGSFGVNALRHAPCSVLVVPETATWSAAHAVVGMDFSHDSTSALVAACGLFDKVDVVYHFTPETSGHGSITEEEFATLLADNLKKHFKDDVVPLLPAGADPVLRLVPGNRASDCLIEEAGDQPVVIGSRGMSRLAALVLGSTAERVSGRHAGVVLVTRVGGDDMGLLEALVHR